MASAIERESGLDPRIQNGMEAGCTGCRFGALQAPEKQKWGWDAVLAMNKQRVREIEVEQWDKSAGQE